METCDYCTDHLDPYPPSPVLDPGTDEVRLACDRCGHVVTLELAPGARSALAA
ncbi:MAG TPA: hypothetical protein VEW93_07725 [Acidimicrobiales bacterium]|nr:hypothetical protein [Acidimicrobiales bacterium]